MKKMIELIKQRLKKEMTNEEKLNYCREFIQILCLKILDENRAFENMAFTGGTALRVVYGVKRFSEDLDFSVFKKGGRQFAEINEKLVKGINLAGLDVASKVKTKNTVHNSMLRFPGILKKLRLASLKTQNLSIKLEVDTNPPEGGNTQSRFIQQAHVFNITCFDLPSMFATKLHACFYRKYIKGRDFYDFIWYVSNKVKPNFVLLNNAIKQTHGVSPAISEANFKEFLFKGLERVDFTTARKDVERFLEDKKELRLLDAGLIKDNIESVYGKILP
jgi:predicted nucleotidyltransferase component of viral defense system